MTTLRWVALLVISTIAIARCMIAFAPQVWFDIDPALDPLPFAGMSMAGSLALDVVLLIACSVGLVAERMQGRPLNLILLTLAAIPAPIVLHHAWRDAGDLWRGSTWLAAAFAAVTVAHLARDRAMRVVMIALLLAVVAPLLVRGGLQVTIEHADTVAAYEANRDAFLADRGWEPDSAQAQIFERRLRQAQPAGWFPTTNIFGSVMVVGLVFSAGLLIASRRMAFAWRIGTALFICACGGALWLTGSKGAIGAAMIGLIVAIVPLLSSQAMGLAQRWGRILLILLAPLALLAIVARGTLLPEGFLNEKSLLFRWHYLVSSGRMASDASFFGVGPDGFQTEYTRFRLPRNPEEVISAHSMFIDWRVTLGVLGLAWCGLCLALIAHAGRTVSATEQNELPSEEEQQFFRHTLPRLAVGMAFLAWMPSLMAEAHVIGPLDALLRSLGVAGLAAVALALAALLRRTDHRAASWSFAAAAGALLVHGQIEMTFFLPGSVMWAMCILGVSAAGGMRPLQHSPSAVRRAMEICLSITPVACAVWLGATGMVPSMIQQSKVAHAASALIPFSERPSEQAAQRIAAADRLVSAHASLKTNALPLQAAVRQLELAAARAPEGERVQLLHRALTIADMAVVQHCGSGSIGLRAAIAAHLAAATGDIAYMDMAIADVSRLTERDPHGIQPWQSLGDLLWLSGRRHEAADAYRRAMEADRNFELDELKRMPLRVRQLIEQRLREVEEH